MAAKKKSTGRSARKKTAPRRQTSRKKKPTAARATKKKKKAPAKARAARPKTPPASERARREWLRRVEAEYRSAAITHELTLWLIRIAASPDLIVDGLRIVKDELKHAELSHLVYTAGGGSAPPQIARETLGIARRGKSPLEHDVLRAPRWKCFAWVRPSPFACSVSCAAAAPCRRPDVSSIAFCGMRFGIGISAGPCSNG